MRFVKVEFLHEIMYSTLFSSTQLYRCVVLGIPALKIVLCEYKKNDSNILSSNLV